MPKKRYRPEEIIAELREAEVLPGQGQKAPDVVKRRTGRVEEACETGRGRMVQCELPDGGIRRRGRTAPTRQRTPHAPDTT